LRFCSSHWRSTISFPDDGFPPPLSPADAAELKRRQRGRNIALLIVLVAVIVLFYAISIVKLGHG
jgi:hypothetical protein